ncbi:uncharacterized protein [Anolis sagrei]|uniref:uncharacterized protein n=1 Tax=Anolis sagrei TaxID=38937 RepID=UPI003520B7CA
MASAPQPRPDDRPEDPLRVESFESWVTIDNLSEDGSMDRLWSQLSQGENAPEEMKESSSDDLDLETWHFCMVSASQPRPDARHEDPLRVESYESWVTIDNLSEDGSMDRLWSQLSQGENAPEEMKESSSDDLDLETWHFCMVSAPQPRPDDRPEDPLRVESFESWVTIDNLSEDGSMDRLWSQLSQGENSTTDIKIEDLEG